MRELPELNNTIKSMYAVKFNPKSNFNEQEELLNQDSLSSDYSAYDSYNYA